MSGQTIDGARPNPMLTLLQIPGDRTVAYVPAAYLRMLTETIEPLRLAFRRYGLQRALSIVRHIHVHTHIDEYMHRIAKKQRKNRRATC